jgi:hypothetical protein
MLLFPQTPNLRYERMALSLLASLVFLALTIQFGSMAWQVISVLPATGTLAHSHGILRLGAFVAAAAAFLCITLAFTCFTLIKIQPRNWEKARSAYVRVRKAGLVLVGLAFTFVGVWIIANLALLFIL